MFSSFYIIIKFLNIFTVTCTFKVFSSDLIHFIHTVYADLLFLPRINKAFIHSFIPNQREPTQDNMKALCQEERPEKRTSPKRKGWALYRNVSELVLSLKERSHWMEWNQYAKVQRTENWAYFWEEGLSTLPEGEWAVVETHRGMTQDKWN